jgi:hypothetical protein
MEKKNRVIVSDDILMNIIYIIRDQKVMLDRDLAELYGVETKYLKRQVKRNIDRFPEDFMFELSTDEFENLRCQFGTSKLNEANFLRSQFATSKAEDSENVDIEAKNSMENRGGTRYLPMAFTEQGIAMLSSILNSKQAIQTNIQIMRIFTRTRKLLLENVEIMKLIQIIEQKTDGNTKSIELLFEYMDQLMAEKEIKEKPRKLIGFKKGRK